jgi:NAD(P)-dependent dehydrogenase (short-subunit alcohol dehydrogenase family)
MNGLSGKIALVTGATGLIGGAAALRLANEGARVAVASRSIESAERWCDENRTSDTDLLPLLLDVSSEESIGTGLEALRSAYGQPTIMVASAIERESIGIPMDELTIDSFLHVQRVDVAGNFICAREMADGIAEQSGGSIVWLSSIYGSRGADYSIYPEGMMQSPVHYGATKAAVQGLVRNLAGAWGPRGIRVNAVVSGGVRDSDRQNAEFVARYSRKTMLGRMAEPDEIGSACAFLASDDASYITGACLDVDGGFLAM